MDSGQFYPKASLRSASVTPNSRNDGTCSLGGEGLGQNCPESIKGHRKLSWCSPKRHIPEPRFSGVTSAEPTVKRSEPWVSEAKTTFPFSILSLPGARGAPGGERISFFSNPLIPPLPIVPATPSLWAPQMPPRGAGLWLKNNLGE